MTRQQQNSENIIDRTMKINGNVSFKGTAIIEGFIEGNITGDTIIITETAEIVGDLVLDKVHCRGKVTGTITSASLHIGPRAQIKGTLATTILEVQPGAKVDCEIKSGNQQVKRKEIEQAIPQPTGGAQEADKRETITVKTDAVKEEVMAVPRPVEVSSSPKPTLHFPNRMDMKNREGFFPEGEREKIAQSVIKAILSSKEMVRVTGALGSGKSTVCKKVCDKLRGHYKIVQLNNVVGSTREIYLRIAKELNVAIDEELSQNDILKRLKKDLDHKKQASERVLLVLDNSHEMYPATLEGVIRNLSHSSTTSGAVLQIILVGDEPLNKHLDPKAANYFTDHQECSFELRPLTPEETRAYINFKLDEIQRCMNSDQPVDFPIDSMAKVYTFSNGLIGKINKIIEQAIDLAGKKKNRKVAAKFVKNI